MVFAMLLSLTLIFIITFVSFVSFLHPRNMDIWQSSNLQANKIVVTFVKKQYYLSPNNGFHTYETMGDIPIQNEVVRASLILQVV
jgi:hypothetical protein